MTGKKIVGIILFVLLMLSTFLFFQEEAEAEEIDFILLTDAPNGTVLTTVNLSVGGKVTAYASGYNSTSGYVDLVVVDWREEAWPRLGSLDNSTGTSSTFTAGNSGGNTSIMGSYTSYINDTFNVSILDPTIDYIDITDTPGGTPLAGGPVFMGHQEWGNCSAYNDTSGYIDVVDADWTAAGGNAVLLGSSPNVTNGIDVGTIGGVSVWFNATYGIFSDSVEYMVSLPAIDYLNITDIPNGTTLAGGPVPVGHQEWGHCSAYNYTYGYIDVADADWTAGGGNAVLLNSSPDTTNGIDVGTIGGVSVWFNASYSGFSYSVEYTIISPTVDYIDITDTPDGNPLTDKIVPPGHREWGNCSAYNDTSGYIDVVDADWTAAGGNAFLLGSSPNSTNGIDVGTIQGVPVWFNASYGGSSDSVEYLVLSPTIDYIDITDTPDGTPLAGGDVEVGYQEWGYCSAYNYSSGYIDVVDADWTVTGGNAILLGSTPNSTNGIDVGTVGGAWVYFDASYSVLSDSVLYGVIPPTIDYVYIRDASGGGGINLSDPANYPSYPLGSVDTFYGAAYNYTVGYIHDVNASTTWTSTNSSIVHVTSPGSSSTITCNDTNWGTVTITLDVVAGPSTTTEVTVLEPMGVDFIQITDIPDGVRLPDQTVPICFRIWGNCSAYNNSKGYIGTRIANWSADGGTSYLIGSSHANNSGIDVDITPGKVWFNASYDGHTDSVVYNVIPPTVDFILLTDMPNQNGTEIPHMSWEVGEPLFIYASGYNSSGKIGPLYVEPVEVNWTDTPDLGDFDNLTGTATIFTGSSVGVTYIEGNNITLGLGDFFILNLSTHANIDFIILTDTPNGSALNTVTIPVGGEITAYASGYNMTLGYVGLVEVNWSDSPDLGYFDHPTGSSATYTAGSNGGTTTITGQNTQLGVSDIFTVEILPPTLDSIILTDIPNGSELTTVVLYSGENVTAYASGYNATCGYFMLIDVNWSESAGLGTLDILFGTSTTFTAGASSGVTTITGINYSLGISDTFNVSINPPTLDFINITDAPNGIPLITVILEVYGSVTAYASGYNHSAGYIGLVEVNWSESQGLGSLDNIFGTSTTFTAGKIGGLTTITGENNPLGVSDSFDVYILPPEVDYIILTDAPNGTTLTLVTLNVGESITVYASAYNDTCDYIGLIWVSWDEPAGLGNLDNSSGTSTTFTAGHEGGSTTITGINSSEGVSDSFDVNINPPKADYILIRTQPGGGGLNLCDPANYRSYPLGGTDTYYGAMYNYTTNYFDDVPSNASWVSSNELIVKVTSPGSSTDLDCDDKNWGTVTITLTVSGKQNTSQVTVIKPAVDYIILTDAPNGTTLTLVTLNVGESIIVYASAYNNTCGYIGLIPVNWDESAGLGTLDNSSGTSTTFTAGHEGGSTTITGQNSSEGVSDSFDVNINPPTADYILIRTQPGGGGFDLCDPANYKSYPVGGTDTYYGAMYNYTTDYFDDIPDNAFWFSSNELIVKVTSPGSLTNITCDDQNWGTVTIILSASGKQNTTQVTVLEPTVDYILIRDEAGGLGNIVTTKTYVVWEVDHFYAAAYNDTADYLGEVEVVWESDDPNVGKVTSPGLWTNFTAQKVVTDITCRVSADYFGIGDSTGDLTILAPRIDYITIMDSQNGSGAWVGDITYNEEDKDVFWAAGYNDTADYVKDVEATWESDNTTVGKVTLGPDEYTDFTAGIKGGYCKVTATFGTLSNLTGNLFVINVNTLPSAEAKYHNGTGFSGGNFTFSTDITLRVTGRKQNIITMKLEEDGTIVKEVEVTRHSGNPDTGEISHEMSVQKVYRIVLVYNGHNGGSNPIIVTFEFLERIYSVHLLFNSQDGENQEAILPFNDVIPLVGVVFFDASLSSDFEGYLDDYQWNFGDESTGSGETLAHAYDENDEYTVTLTVTDDEGGTDSSTITVPVENIDDNNQANAIPSQKGAKGFLNESGECVVILQCPADLLIKNPEGRQIGFLEGHPIMEIEGAFISMRYSDIEVYYIPLDERYTFEVRGTGVGIYDLSVIRVSDDIVRKYGVLDVTCSENTVDIYVFDFNEEQISISTNEDDKLYSLGISTSIDDQLDNFILTDMKLKEDATHIYRIKNWEVLSSGKPVTLYIDEDGDGTIDERIDLKTGLSGDEVDTLILKEPVSEPFPLLLLIIACSIFALGAGGLLTEVGKVALLTLFLPLYTRLKKEELLDQPTRYKIYGYVLGNPGAYFLLMKEVLELGSGQLVYHLKQLEEAKLIYSRVDGAKKRFYPAHVPKLKGGLHHLSAIEQKIFGIIRNNSGIGQKKIASTMGISRQVAGYHLTQMARKGMINKEVVGRRNRYYPSEEYGI